MVSWNATPEQSHGPGKTRGSENTLSAPKGSMAILENDDNRTEKQKEIFQRAPESHGVVRRIWKFKEDFPSLFGSST
ncbi:MAG: hypothetical protein OXE77_05135 [Flavobacteriaceae bacterium]|nr:hypothetical protein [Flavobacteriaceae bacterium]MCY4267194.1 hypothetical protein [Flavobacteriaceae bacterium]